MSQELEKIPAYRVRKADEIVSYLLTGASIYAAAGQAGVPQHAVDSWMEKNKAFRDRVEMAQAGAELLMTGRIREAGIEDWRANAYLIERREATTELARLRALTTEQ